MKITNNAPRPEGFHTSNGLVFLKQGETRDLDLTPEGFKMAARLPFVGIEGVDRSEAMQMRDVPPDQTETPESETDEYTVKDKGRGWFVVMKGDEEVTKSFREADAKEFETLSAEDKVAFIELNKAD